MHSQVKYLSSSSEGTTASRMPGTTRSSGETTSTSRMISTIPSSTMLQHQCKSTSSGSSNSRRGSNDNNKYTHSAQPNRELSIHDRCWAANKRKKMMLLFFSIILYICPRCGCLGLYSVIKHASFCT